MFESTWWFWTEPLQTTARLMKMAVGCRRPCSQLYRAVFITAASRRWWLLRWVVSFVLGLVLYPHFLEERRKPPCVFLTICCCGSEVNRLQRSVLKKANTGPALLKHCEVHMWKRCSVLTGGSAQRGGPLQIPCQLIFCLSHLSFSPDVNGFV